MIQEELVRQRSFCAEHQIAVDLFISGGLYNSISTLKVWLSI